MSKPLFPPKEDPPTWTPQEWRALTDHEREWYVLFWRATVQYDWKALQVLCDQAGADFDSLFKSLNYDSHLSNRMEYTINAERKPRFTEWDYKWSQPSKPTTREQVASADPGKSTSQEKVPPRKVYLDDADRYGPSPVRKVSAEEYYATKKAPQPKGVNLETELKYRRKEKEDDSGRDD